jgi:hypothetical protein
MSADAKQLDNFHNPAKRTGKAKTDYRDTIEEAPPPRAGFATAIVEEVVASGASGVRNAQRIAMRHARAALVEASDHWKKDTPFILAALESSEGNQRAQARNARVWRPRFLAALSITHAPTLSARHARIALSTVYLHREQDADFAAMWEAAQEAALDLLHARVWQRSLEGDLEPVYFMGVRVGHVRKFSDKLQIELLRAWKPDRFKSAGVQVSIATRGDVFLLTEAQRAELKALNRAFLSDPRTLDGGGAGAGGVEALRLAGASE